MTATEALERRIDELCCENARLRERLVHMELHECPGCRNVADLQEALDENTKLRELVLDMAECMDNSQPRCKKCKFRELNCQWFKFFDRMRELGIEVE